MAAHRKKVGRAVRITRDLVLGAILAGVGNWYWKRYNKEKRLRQGLCLDSVPKICNL